MLRWLACLPRDAGFGRVLVFGRLSPSRAEKEPPIEFHDAQQ